MNKAFLVAALVILIGSSADAQVFDYITNDDNTLTITGYFGTLKCDLPANTSFHSGNRLTATPPLSATRNCQIITIEDCFSFFILTVADISQNV